MRVTSAGVRPCSARSAMIASSAAKVWPQQPWFFCVVRVIVQSSPSPATAAAQSTSPLIARPKPRSPSSIPSAPVTPQRAASAASSPASAARPACRGLVIASERNACCSPAAMLATPFSACAVRAASSPSTQAADTAAPKQPTVAVVCHQV